MDLLTTILTCSLYLADDDLVRAIAESNSHSNPYSVLDASVDLTQLDPPPPPRNAAEAVALVADISAKGGRPLLGLMQEPASWMGAFERELAAAFDPCTNVAIGTAMLSQFDYECDVEGARKGEPAARKPTAARRRCVLHKYEEAIHLADFVTITTLELRYQRRVQPSVEGAPIFAPSSSSTRNWGPDQLLVSMPSLSVTALPRSGP